MVQQQYLAEWHDAFVRYVKTLLAFVDSLMLLPQAKEENKKDLEKVKDILSGKEVDEIKNNLADGAKSGVLKKGTIEKIEKLDKDLVDYALERISTNHLWIDFLRQISIIRIEQAKNATITRLNELQIPVIE